MNKTQHAVQYGYRLLTPDYFAYAATLRFEFEATITHIREGDVARGYMVLDESNSVYRDGYRA